MLIVLEGIDDSGKSTLARALASALDAVILREPAPAVEDDVSGFVRERLGRVPE